MTVDALKQSAAASGSYSLASNQIGITNAIFVMHKELLEGEERQWLHPNAYKQQEEAPLYEDQHAVPLGNLLAPEDFKVIINPVIHAETAKQTFDWEYCLSFPGIRCMVKRPVGIQVSYLDPEGDHIEQ